MRQERIKIPGALCEHFFLALDPGNIKLGVRVIWRKIHSNFLAQFKYNIPSEGFSHTLPPHPLDTQIGSRSWVLFALLLSLYYTRLPRYLSGKESACHAGDKV